ncbi:ribonuclease HII [Ensifer soli]|uniref:ribonuclease HII n=1 Tax=Ciceribacter sp. sgz301302 TaxID=3342379 RepID=UPI0035B93E4D
MSRRVRSDSPRFCDGAPATPPRSGPDFSIEAMAIAAGAMRVAGTDEAGRGPLAGPVVAAAVVLTPERIPAGLDDSKLLTASRREQLFAEILAVADVSVASSPAALIDRIDIRKASLDAMRRAVLGLFGPAPDLVLVDGRDVPEGLPCPGEALVKGDSRSVSVAAASIVAKVLRDRMMARADRDFPEYGFARHAGYGTVEHRSAIARFGPCALHRMSFRPLRTAEQKGAAPLGSAEPRSARGTDEDR